MKNAINTQSGERLSFFKLFSEKGYRIQIPIIQRDYAQGRKSTKEVRNTFLDALSKYLDENKPNRDLDFVYGSLNEEDNITDFIPLDGQQRLTTLFLLHWYLCQISDNAEKKEVFKNTLLKNGKSLFTYETRSSSSEFCDALMSNDIDFDNLLESIDKDKNLSKTIKNCSWFYLSWKFDPTIQSMLTMLDAIHNKFSFKKEYFERLMDVESPIITFLFLNLTDFKLTDDLYIKMNSRGKPLTPFENFKAKFEQYLETIKHDRNFYLSFDSKNKNVSLSEYFSFNIDTKWANLFWEYRTLQNRSKIEIDDTFDDELINFMRVIFTNQYAVSVDVLLKDKDDSLEYLLGTNVARKDKEYSDTISLNKYLELNALSKESILYLVDAFDCFVNGNQKIKTHLSEEYKLYFDENKIFENALKHNFDSNQERLCFHAYVRYLILNKNERSGINQWMRVIHNLTHPENTIIDNASEVAAAIKSIEELLPHSNNILEHLKTNPTITLFSTWQVTEEKIKAHLITKDGKWKNKIEEIEKHKYFTGQIGFLLEFSDILDYYKTKNNCDWDDMVDDDYFLKFSTYVDKANKVFEESYENRINDNDFIFERAVLTKGDYLTTASQNRKNLLSTSLVKNNIKRDHSWKRLLRISDESVWSNRRSLVKQVFDDSRFDIDKLANSLKTICKDKTNSWRDYFITCPALIEYCKQGFIRFENDYAILLYGESQSNHVHTEMYTYFLWKVYIESQKSTFEPFKNLYYNGVKSIEDYACIVLNGFCHNRINYQIEIFYCNSDLLENPYEIAFKKSKGENIPEKYGDDIKVILEQCDFEWNEDYSGYFYTSKKSKELIECLKRLTEKINNIV
ncbi:MAG: DUF262 domain-containing protein [Paludibacter sp.]